MPHLKRYWLNSVAPTQLRASGPCRTHHVLTWYGLRDYWAASVQCSVWSWILW